MKKYALMLGLALCLALLLGGCAFRPVDELYALPKLPGDYQNLQAKIEEVTVGKGAEYSAPAFGSNTQPVQFHDLDGDGVLEALAFFKVSGDEKPLKIYIFHLTDQGYEVAAVVEGAGASIYSVGYEDLNDTPFKELIVSWQKSPNVNTLAVYAIDGYEVGELLSVPYTAFDVLDLNMDNRKEILVTQVDTLEGKGSRVDCYAAEKASLTLTGSAPLSQGITALEADTTRKGYLKGSGVNIPALYITSTLGEKLVTDIFAFVDGAFKNVTLNPETGLSSVTYRDKDKAKPMDINGDGVLELPIPICQPSNPNVPCFDLWHQYDLHGTASLVRATYHNFDDGWYLILPTDWLGKVTVSAADTTVIGEKRTAFGLWDGEKSTTFLTIYRLTGPNRHMRATMGERFTIYADDNVIYSAEFTGTWDSGLGKTTLKDHFKISQTDWTG